MRLYRFKLLTFFLKYTYLLLFLECLQIWNMVWMMTLCSYWSICQAENVKLHVWEMTVCCRRWSLQQDNEQSGSLHGGWYLSVCEANYSGWVELSVECRTDFLYQDCSTFTPSTLFTWKDIKPENIVCENLQEFNIKLVDFGLSRRLAEERDICVMQGTPDFVSPEMRSEKELILTLTLLIDNQVINYEPIGPGSDMWSVGVITFLGKF